MWSLLQRRAGALAEIGAHHVVVYRAMRDARRVLVTIGIRNREPIIDLLKSPVMFQWFDVAGVEDIPAVFAGEVVEKIDLHDRSAVDVPPRVVIAAMASVDDPTALVAQVHAGLERFKQAQVRKIWIYRAFDDDHEVMILQEVSNVDTALRWIDHPDAAAEWIARTGIGAYPAVFVGSLMNIMKIDARC